MIEEDEDLVERVNRAHRWNWVRRADGTLDFDQPKACIDCGAQHALDAADNWGLVEWRKVGAYYTKEGDHDGEIDGRFYAECVEADLRRLETCPEPFSARNWAAAGVFWRRR